MTVMHPSHDHSAMLAFYDKNGYWIEPDIFSAQQCDTLMQAARQLNDFGQGNLRPAMMPHRENSAFLEALKNPKLVAIMEQLVGGKAAGLQTEYFYCPPGTNGFSRHQDNFFVEAEYGTFASAWCAMQDTDASNGGLIGWPGTHQAGLLPVEKISVETSATQDPNANNEQCIIPPEYAPINVTVPKGAAFFIHGHFVHASNTNASEANREVLLSTYVQQGKPFRPGKYAAREALDLYG